MATHEFLFPDVGEGIHEGQLVEWLAQEGDSVKEDQPLCRVETDKAVVEIPSPTTGKILKFHGSPGELIIVGNVLVTFETEGDNATPPPQNGSSAAATPAAAPVVTAPVSVATPIAVATPVTPVAAIAPVPVAGRPQDVRATPHTRALARKLGVDITTVVGTGRAGRITDEDIDTAAGQAPVQAAHVVAPTATTRTAPAISPAAAPTLSSTEYGSEERVPMSFLKRRMAEQMALSMRKLTHVTHVEEADLTEFWDVYGAAKARLKKDDIKLSPLAYFVKAIVAALKAYPIFNSTWDQETGEITYKHYYNIGIAVDTPEGLVVPVIKNAETKSIAQIATEIADLAKRARTRDLKLEEMRGGTFTITNIGPLGGVHATPIINYPEVAIIGVHSIEDRPAVVDGEICIRKRMFLSTSFDHQVIDGATGARFMRLIATMLGDPSYLFTQI